MLAVAKQQRYRFKGLHVKKQATERQVRKILEELVLLFFSCFVPFSFHKYNLLYSRLCIYRSL